jgi:hypothetical protein
VRSLDELLAAAADADGLTRITFRDLIAAFGDAAIVRLEPWLSDPRLAAFAVRTIERAASQPGAALSARAILRRARGRGGETTHRDIDEALVRLGRRTPSSPPRRSRGTVPRVGHVGSRSSRGLRAGLPATIHVLRNMTPGDVWAAVDGFSAKYAKDWDDWLAADRNARPELFGRILRSWQATRPLEMRRLKAEARPGAPPLDELLEAATEPLSALGDLTVLTVPQRTSRQDAALIALWDVFSHLTTTALASCVGITKAVLLLTDGKIGPALDNQVRMGLGVGGPAKFVSCTDWLQVLRGVGDDIAAYESAHGPLVEAVPPRFAHLEYGRLYDMAIGPR